MIRVKSRGYDFNQRKNVWIRGSRVRNLSFDLNHDLCVWLKSNDIMIQIIVIFEKIFLSYVSNQKYCYSSQGVLWFESHTDTWFESSS